MAIPKRLTKDMKFSLNAFENFRGRIATAISAAFAFVIALSWNDTIKTGVDKLIANSGLNGTSYLYAVSVSLIVTFICVLGIYLSSKLAVQKSN